MANLTYTVGGNNNLVSFRSAARVPIENLKVHFKPIQEGEGGPSPENVRPIVGWNNCQVYKMGKNIGQVVGYNAQNSTNSDDHNNLTNAYGTTINTNSYNLPDTSLIITQTQAPNETTSHSYQNGYFAIMVKNLIYGQSYDVSFKVTNITNNLLNKNLNNIELEVPSGAGRFPSQIIGNVLIYKNVKWRRYSQDPSNNSYNRSNFEIRNCGMSFTLSEFMVTPAGMNDGVFEPYCGEVLPITFPNISKNLFEFTPFNETDWSTNHVPLSPTTDTNTNTITITGYGSGDSQLYNLKNIYYPGTYTFSFDMTYVSERTVAKRMVIRCYDDNDELMNSDDLSIEGFTYNQYYHGWWAIPTTFTVPDSVNYFKLSVGVGGEAKGDTVSFSNIQLEYGETATAYEPYSFNNTIYGGYVDLAKGELVATKLYAKIPLSSFTKTEYEDRDGYVITRINLGYPIADAVGNVGKISNIAPYQWEMSNNGKVTKFFAYRVTSENNLTAIYLSLPKNIDENIDFEMVTDLLEPITYPLASTQLTTFLNQNNIWSNTNDVTEVSYQIHDSNMIRNIKKQIINNAPKLQYWLCGNDAPVNGSWIERVQGLEFKLRNGADWDPVNKRYNFDTTSKGAYLVNGSNVNNFYFGHHWQFDFDIWINKYRTKDSTVFFDIGSVTEANKALGFGLDSFAGNGKISFNWKLNGNESNPLTGRDTYHPSYPLPTTDEYVHVIGSYKIIDGGDGYDRLVVKVNGVTVKYNDIQIPKATYGPTWNKNQLTVGTSVYNYYKLYSNTTYSTYSPCCYIKDIKIYILD